MLKVKKLSSFGERLIGLSASIKITPVYFETRFGIHTLGMKYAIDVLVLDQNNKVVKVKTALKPNRLFFWNPKYYKVLELPSGFIAKRKIKIGQKLDTSFR